MIVELDALGTRWWITLPKDVDKDIPEEVKNIIKQFESDYSRFDDKSYIGKLNKHKTLKNPPLELFHMLTYALDVYSQTEGVFNISIGSELEKSGYGKTTDMQSKVSEDLTHDVKISPAEIKLSKTTRIDLGGFGKGWLIEKVAGFLKNKGIKDFVVNGGGDITARGKARKIYIENPLDSTEHIGSLSLHNSSLASSSNLKRSWERAGSKQAHIIHPSGKSTDKILSMHVMAGNILFADTFATIYMLVDRKKRLEYSKRYGFDFMEVLEDMSLYKSPGFDIKLN